MAARSSSTHARRLAHEWHDLDLAPSDMGGCLVIVVYCERRLRQLRPRYRLGQGSRSDESHTGFPHPRTWRVESAFARVLGHLDRIFWVCAVAWVHRTFNRKAKPVRLLQRPLVKIYVQFRAVTLCSGRIERAPSDPSPASALSGTPISWRMLLNGTAKQGSAYSICMPCPPASLWIEKTARFHDANYPFIDRKAIKRVAQPRKKG